MWSSNNRSISEDASWVTTNSLKQQQLLQNTSTLNNSLSTPTLTSATPPTQSLNDAVYVNIIDDEDDNVNTSTSQSMHQSNPKVQVSHQPLRSTPSSARVGGALRKINSSTGSLNQPNGKLHSTFSSTHLSASQSPRLTPRHIASTHSGTHTPTVHANQYLNGGTNFDMSAIPTEFVFRDAQPDAVHVNLCGDWNKWKKIPLENQSPAPLYSANHSQRNLKQLKSPKKPMWVVITPVPVGYHEFCFEVDGEFCISSQHPISADGSSNWRTIHGPGGVASSRGTATSSAASSPRSARRGIHGKNGIVSRFMQSPVAVVLQDFVTLVRGIVLNENNRTIHRNQHTSTAGTVFADMAVLSGDAAESFVERRHENTESNVDRNDENERAMADLLAILSPQTTTHPQSPVRVRQRRILNPVRFFLIAMILGILYLAFYYCAIVFL